MCTDWQADFSSDKARIAGTRRIRNLSFFLENSKEIGKRSLQGHFATKSAKTREYFYVFQDFAPYLTSDFLQSTIVPFFRDSCGFPARSRRKIHRQDGHGANWRHSPKSIVRFGGADNPRFYKEAALLNGQQDSLRTEHNVT